MSSGHLKAESPVDALTARSEADHVAAATVGRIRNTFSSGRTKPLEWRLRQLAGIERLVRNEESVLAAALQSDIGRPPHLAWMGDFAATVSEARFAQKHLRKWVRPRRTGIPLPLRPARAFYKYEPLGVILIIGPWNYPINTTLIPMIGALAAGNAAVLKPSEHAPATAEALAELIPRYLDSEAVAVVNGDAQVTQALLAQDIDHVFFTGGGEIGKKVMAAAADRLIPVTLELGGKSPVIVAADADLDVAARRIAMPKLLNSGQTCISPDYVLVESSVRDAFVKKLAATLKAFQAGRPTPLPIVNERQFRRLLAALDDHGGEVVVGGGSDQRTLAIEPTVVVEPDPSSTLMSEEIFGPVLPVLGVASINDAIAFVNSRPKPLALYVFTGSMDVSDRVIDQTSSGGVCVNQAAMHGLVPQLPFGGVGASGMGAYHGEWGFQQLSHRKAVLSARQKPDPSMLYPPYTPVKRKMLRRLF